MANTGAKCYHNRDGQLHQTVVPSIGGSDGMHHWHRLSSTPNSSINLTECLDA